MDEFLHLHAHGIAEDPRAVVANQRLGSCGGVDLGQHVAGVRTAEVGVKPLALKPEPGHDRPERLTDCRRLPRAGKAKTSRTARGWWVPAKRTDVYVFSGYTSIERDLFFEAMVSGTQTVR